MSRSAPIVLSKPAGRLLPLLLLLLLGSGWGLTFPTSKIAMSEGVGPMGYVFWQTAGAGAALLLVCGLRRRLPRCDLRHLAYYAVCGLVGVTLPNAILLAAIAHLPASLTALIVNTAPLLTFAMVLGLGLERFEARRAAGLLLGFAGAALLALGGAALDANPDGGSLLGWVAFAFLGPLCYAGVAIYNQRRRPAGSDSLALACGMVLMGFLGSLPLTWVRGEFDPLWRLGPGELAVLLQIAISSLAYALQFEIIRLAGAVYFSQVSYITAATALSWSYVILGERLSGVLALAVALIFGGLALVNWPRPAPPIPSRSQSR
ncbi:MAG: DMT family transporter [Pseudomonadota bacterium]